MRIFRGCFASLLGVIIAVVAVFEISNAVMFILKIACSFAMVFVAFGKFKFWKMLKDFYLFTFGIGGTAMGILYLKQGVDFGVFKSVANIPVGVIFGVIFAGYIFTKRIIYIFNRKGTTLSNSFGVEIFANGKDAQLHGFLDTGNLLVFGGDLRGVCVGEYKRFASIFAKQKPWGQVAITTANGGDFLFVYKVDLLKIYEIDKKNPIKKLCENKLICVEKDVPFALSMCEFAGEFEVLLSPMMMK